MSSYTLSRSPGGMKMLKNRPQLLSNLPEMSCAYSSSGLYIRQMNQLGMTISCSARKKVKLEKSKHRYIKTNQEKQAIYHYCTRYIAKDEQKRSEQEYTIGHVIVKKNGQSKQAEA